MVRHRAVASDRAKQPTIFPARHIQVATPDAGYLFQISQINEIPCRECAMAGKDAYTYLKDS